MIFMVGITLIGLMQAYAFMFDKFYEQPIDDKC